MKQQQRDYKPNKPEPSQDRQVRHSIGSDAALAALRRASDIARRRALETTGSVAIFRDGEIVYETDPKALFSEPQEWLNASCCIPRRPNAGRPGGESGCGNGNPS